MPRKVIEKTAKRVVAFFILLLLVSSLCTGALAAEHGGEMESEHLPKNETESVIDRIVRGFEEFETSIDISEYDVSPDELLKLFADATKNSPYLFYVGNHLSYTYRKGGGVISLIPEYDCTIEEAAARVEFCREEIKKLAALAVGLDSDMARVEYAHDIICRRFKYDLTLESDDLYSFLKTREGTCQGYTWAYMALLRELGIECQYVASDEIVHIWLKLKIDGEWYHSDVTWDDPSGEEGQNNGVSRRHFLFSDVKADTDGYIERYSVNDVLCTSDKHDMAVNRSYHEYGDIDHSGRIDLYDIIEIRRCVELSEGSEFCPICTDLSCDLMINAFDVANLREMLLNLP